MKGIDWRSWSARLLLDVLETAVLDTIEDPLERDRVRNIIHGFAPNEAPPDWGTVKADDVPSVLEAMNR